MTDQDRRGSMRSKTASQMEKQQMNNSQQILNSHQSVPQQQGANGAANGSPQQQQQQQQQQAQQGQNTTTTSTIKDPGAQSNDIAKWWPVFGRKSAGSSTTFWLKNPKQLTLDELEAENNNINNTLSALNPDEILMMKSKDKINVGNTDLASSPKEHISQQQIQTQQQQQQQIPQGTQPNGQQQPQQPVVQAPLSSVLNRIGKKKKNSKEYVYVLQGNFLVYYSQASQQDKDNSNNKGIFKGYLKLGQEIVIEKKSLQSKSGDIFYIEFLKDGNVRKLYSKDKDIVNKLFEAIRGKCILQNFRENYKKLELLGSGSFASVYKVQRIQDGKIFAAKIIKRVKLEENKFKEKFVAMLVNEYVVLAESSHKNIIHMEEIFQDADQLCYIMEYLVGGEIYARLRTLKRFTEDVSAEIMKNLTDGLQHIHNKKIVHRDLKLENVMFVDKTGNDCKLIDFGFAEKINYEKLESRAGTPGFLPPELFKLGPYTEKGDIFSLGIILYCLISGYSPFKGKTYKDVLDNNRKCAISYDQPIWTRVTDECKYLIKRMVEPDPKKRYNCEDILRSKWITKYYPYSPIQSQKSLNTTKTGKASKKKPLSSSFSRNSLLEDDLRRSLGSNRSGESGGELNTSTIINLHSENPKSFYRKSMRSLKSIKSLKSHFSHKTVRSHNSYSSLDNISPTHNSHPDLNKTLWENYKDKHFDNNVAKFKEEINNYGDVDVADPDEPNNLTQKLRQLLTPDKKFIHPLTLAASKHFITNH